MSILIDYYLEIYLLHIEKKKFIYIVLNTLLPKYH